VFNPITKALDTARLAIDLFNEAYKQLLILTGQSIPVPLVNTAPGYTVDPNTGRQIPISGGAGGGATTVTTTVNIGTQKVDTVISEALRRIAPGGRSGNQ
jgi:alpha-D-ribose 1-methylphosphonate 5-phosphate C-P lyase